jgi:malonate decarboxylase alpha subunit
VETLEALLVPGDRVALEGDNQKQADFLSRSLAQVNPHVIHDLHLRVREHQPSRALGSRASKALRTALMRAYAGPQSLRLAQRLEDGKLVIGAIHTSIELYARLFTDLAPQIAPIIWDL